MNKTYQQLSKPICFELEEKRSRFICYLFPVTSRQMVMEHIDALSQQYPDARHICWAYIIGDPNQPVTQAYNDDGEPAGTAGKPILNVLTQREAGDSCALVVRYFGGIKLGAGGLVRAYGGAVSAALDNACLVTKVPTEEFQVLVHFNYEAVSRHLIAEFSGEVLAVEYADQVSIAVILDAEKKADFCTRLQQATSGSAVVVDASLR